MNDDKNQILENPEIQIKEEIKTEGAKVGKKPFFILFFISIIVIALIVLVIQFRQKEKYNVRYGNQTREQATLVPPQSPKIENKFDEFNKYISLRLKSYENIEPGQISEGDSVGDEENPYNLIPGIVSFRAKTETPNEFMYMYILDKKNVQNEEQGKFFAEAYEDIKNKNPENIAKNGKPWALYTTVYGTTLEDLLVEVKSVIYPNTDYVYSLLFLENGHEIAVADEESTNYVIRVFALKGDAIIEIDSYGNFITDLGLSQEDHLKCSEMTGPNEGTDWLTYSGECLSDIYESGKYDEQLTAKTNEMVSAFEIQ